jgi:signal transduction histidine kinase
MIDDLLEVTRIENGKLIVTPGRVSVAEAAADTIETLRETARAKRITLDSDVPDELPAALADPIRLRQILIILLDNAIKFTPDGGAVVVRARVAPGSAAFLEVSVCDNGPGITEATAERLFERLYQAEDPSPGGRRGLGLGLYICRALVTRLGGRISARPAPGTGSVFFFTLPMLSHAASAAAAPLLEPLLAESTTAT